MTAPQGGHHSHAEVGELAGQLAAHRAEVRSELDGMHAQIDQRLAALDRQHEQEAVAEELAAAEAAAAAAAEQAAVAAAAVDQAAEEAAVEAAEEAVEAAAEEEVDEEPAGDLEPPVVPPKPKEPKEPAARSMWDRYPA